MRNIYNEKDLIIFLQLFQNPDKCKIPHPPNTSKDKRCSSCSKISYPFLFVFQIQFSFVALPIKGPVPTLEIDTSLCDVSVCSRVNVISYRDQQCQISNSYEQLSDSYEFREGGLLLPIPLSLQAKAEKMMVGRTFPCFIFLKSNKPVLSKRQLKKVLVYLPGLLKGWLVEVCQQSRCITAVAVDQPAKQRI